MATGLLEGSNMANRWLRQGQDKSVKALGLEPSFVAPRSTLEAIAADQSWATTLLLPWQCELLGVSGQGYC